MEKIFDEIKIVMEHNNIKSVENFVKEYNIGYTREALYKCKREGYLPELSVLLKFCTIFDCELGHLLGEQPCKHHEEQTICDATMLNEQSANILTNLSEFEFEILNNLIVHPDFKGWLLSMYEFTHSHNIITTTINTGIFADTGNAENHSYTKNALKYRVTDLLGDIIEDIYKKNIQKENEKLALKYFTELIYTIDEAITNHFICYDNETGECQTQSLADFTKFVQNQLTYINDLTNNQVKLYQYAPSVYIDNISLFKSKL